jgi:hypothetical protein
MRNSLTEEDKTSKRASEALMAESKYTYGRYSSR